MFTGCSQQLNYPSPSIGALSPSSILAGEPGFNLTVTGGSFTPQSTVLWNNIPRVTIFNSTSSLTAEILTTDIVNAGEAMVEVMTPTPGGGTTLALTFTITAGPSPVPTISSLSPSGTFTGSAGLDLTVTGINFVSLATVTVNGNPRATTFINPTSLVAVLLASDLAQAGRLAIDVINPQPDGGSSNAASFTVSNPTPGVATVSPKSLAAGGTSAAVTVTGTAFVSTSVVTLNGSPRATAFVSATTLQATLTQGDLSAAGIYSVAVASPTPGGGSSNTVTFAVNGSPTTGLPVILDLAPDGMQANSGVCAGGCTGVPTLQTAGPSVSDNGQLVAFASDSTNLVLNQVSAVSNIFLRNTCLIAVGITTSTTTGCSPTTLKVTQGINGTDANGPSSQPTIDSAGAHVAYTSTASNLVSYVAVSGTDRQVYWQATCASGTTNTGCTGTTAQPALVSVSADGTSPANGDSYDPVISPDGQYVAFVSLATNLVSSVLVDGITPQVYIHDTCNLVPPATGSCIPTTYLVSTSDGMTPANGASSSPAVANTGLFVAFVSTATNLGASASNPTGATEVFVRSTCVTTVGTESNTCAPATTLGSTPDGTTSADGASIEPAISGDGRFIVFASTGTNLIVGAGPTQQIYVRDTCTGTDITVVSCNPSTQLVSTSDGKTPANALSESPSTNTSCSTSSTVPCATGQYIAFASLASNLGANVQNGIENVFTRNTCNGASSVVVAVTFLCASYTFLSSQPGGTNPPPANGTSVAPALSGDGLSVGFISSAANLVANDTNALPDVFLAQTSQVFNLTVSLLGTGTGTVSDGTGQITCTQTAATSTTPITQTGTCVGKYVSGSTVTLSATASSGYSFTAWGGSAPSVTNASCALTAGTTTSGSCTFTMIQNNTATATFH